MLEKKMAVARCKSLKIFGQSNNIFGLPILTVLLVEDTGIP